jgi:hypothetical protein
LTRLESWPASLWVLRRRVSQKVAITARVKNWALARAPSRDTQEREGLTYTSPLSTGASVLMSAMTEGVCRVGTQEESGELRNWRSTTQAQTRGRIRGEQDPFKCVFLQVWGTLGSALSPGPSSLRPSFYLTAGPLVHPPTSKLRVLAGRESPPCDISPGNEISARPRPADPAAREMSERDLIESLPG